MKGWQCVVQKGVYKVGDKVVYLPIDSILPHEIESKIFPPDSKVKLSKSRVKTIKLRGAISQGLVVPLDVLGIDFKTKEGTSVRDILGITKFEPARKPVRMQVAGSRASKRETNPNFKKYTNINHLKNYPKSLEGKHCVVSEKIHGCLQAKTKISLADGTTKTIQEIVENKINTEVLSMDSNGKVAPCRILNWFDNGKTDGWKRVKLTRKKLGNGHHYRSITVTPNHRFFNPKLNKYVACSELKTGDSVLMKRDTAYIPYFQQQVILGKMLGDGSLQNRCISFSHKKDHEDYVDHTLRSLGYFAGNKQKDQLSGHGSLMSRGRSISSYEIKEFLEECFLLDGAKQISAHIIGELSPISLAFWFMDDGSLTHHDSQEDRASIATCRYNATSVDYLIAALGRMGLKATKRFTDNKYWRLYFKADEADRLFTLISPYIIPCMQYKLPEQYRGRYSDSIIFKEDVIYKPTLVEQQVISIEDVTNLNNTNKTKYDIETENHNFIANGVVVHNSNFRAGYVENSPNKWWKKALKFLRLLPKYEFAYGSHNVQLQNKLLYSGFYKKNVYAEIVRKYNLDTRLYNGEAVYGEIYGDGIQKNYSYGLKNREIDFVVFDVKIDGKYLNFRDAIAFCKRRGLPYVPLLAINKFENLNLDEYVSGNSLLCPSQKIREGIVVKPFYEEKGYMGRMIFKYINPDYLLKDQTEYH